MEEDETGDEPQRGVVCNGGIGKPLLETRDGGILRDFRVRREIEEKMKDIFFLNWGKVLNIGSVAVSSRSLISGQIADKYGPNCGGGQLKNLDDVAAQITVAERFIKTFWGQFYDTLVSGEEK